MCVYLCVCCVCVLCTCVCAYFCMYECTCVYVYVYVHVCICTNVLCDACNILLYFTGNLHHPQYCDKIKGIVEFLNVKLSLDELSTIWEMQVHTHTHCVALKMLVDICTLLFLLLNYLLGNYSMFSSQLGCHVNYLSLFHLLGNPMDHIFLIIPCLLCVVLPQRKLDNKLFFSVLGLYCDMPYYHIT